MTKGTTLRCTICRELIGLGYPWWGLFHQPIGGPTPFCVRCVLRADGPQLQGLLDLAGRHGADYVREFLAWRIKEGSTPERSEP